MPRRRARAHETHIQTVLIEEQPITASDGALWLVEGEWEIERVTEMYGQDADGNRGELRTGIEEMTFTLTGASRQDAEGVWGETIDAKDLPESLTRCKALSDYETAYAADPPDDDYEEDDDDDPCDVWHDRRAGL